MNIKALFGGLLISLLCAAYLWIGINNFELALKITGVGLFIMVWFLGYIIFDSNKSPHPKK